MNKLFLVLICALVLTGCTNKAKSSSSTNNPNFNVDFLFEHEGCKIFRFEDSGRYRYYTKCKNSSNTEWSESCGKNCTTNQEVTSSY